MKYQEGQTTTSDGITLYSQTWLPDTAPKGMLAFVHGLGEHTGRYQHVGESLTKAGYGLHMADLRGHGKSPGRRGHIMEFDEFHKDAHAIMDSARKIALDVPQFFGGHSLGGLIALGVLEENPPGYAGAVISAPALGTAFEVPAWKLAMGRVLSRVMPAMHMATDLPVEGLSHDQAIVNAYVNDPLVHGVVSARMAIETFAAQERIMGQAIKATIPTLILHGTEDRVTDPTKSEKFYEWAGCGDKTRLTYDGMYHEICNEIGKERVLDDIIQWMDAHL